jgi:hypothetical protein
VTAEQIAKEGRETALINFYSVANKEVAELCNHQRAAPKNFDEQVRARARARVPDLTSSRPPHERGALRARPTLTRLAQRRARARLPRR